MPIPALKNIAKKHGVRMKTAEKKWGEAKKIVSKEYDKDDPRYWGTVMKITKNKLSKHSKKTEDLDLEMPLFSVNEGYSSDIKNHIYDIILYSVKIREVPYSMSENPEFEIDPDSVEEAVKEIMMVINSE